MKTKTPMTVAVVLAILLSLPGCAQSGTVKPDADKLAGELLGTLALGAAEDTAKAELADAVRGELPGGIVTYTQPGSVAGKDGERILHFLGGTLFQASFRYGWPTEPSGRAAELGAWTDAIGAKHGEPSTHIAVGENDVYNWEADLDGTPVLFIASLVADAQSPTGGYVRVGIAQRDKVDGMGQDSGTPEIADDSVETLLGGLELGAAYGQSQGLLADATSDTTYEGKGLVSYVEHNVDMYGMVGDRSALFLDGALVQVGFQAMDTVGTEATRAGFVKALADNVKKTHGDESLLLESGGVTYEWNDATVGGTKSLISLRAANPMDIGEGFRIEGYVSFTVKEAASADTVVDIYKSYAQGD
jgi:hypothetical protein